MSRETGSPYLTGSIQDVGWVEGYEHGKAQCNHHPEALTLEDYDDGLKSAVNVARIQAHQHGVKAGRQLERDVIGEQLILMAQEYGHAQFVFTRETLEELQGQTSEIVSTLADIETLR